MAPYRDNDSVFPCCNQHQMLGDLRKCNPGLNYTKLGCPPRTVVTGETLNLQACLVVFKHRVTFPSCTLSLEGALVECTLCKRGSYPWPVSPNPCRKTTVAVCFSVGSMTRFLSAGCPAKAWGSPLNLYTGLGEVELVRLTTIRKTQGQSCPRTC
jgi:hypothetical protein